MSRHRVYVTRLLPGGAPELLAQHADVDVWQGDLPPPPKELQRRAAASDGILTLLTDRVDEALLEGAPRLLVVSNMATGFDNVDVAAASRCNVLVTRTPGVLSETVADFTFALLLAAARRVAEADRHVRGGLWQTWGPQVMLGQDVHGATLGIIGLGGVGTEVARRARGLGMRVLYHSRTPKPALERRYRLTRLPLDDLLRQADFVSLHAPLTSETRHLIGRRELRLMKPSAVLVNTARGPLVDQAALYHALTEGRIAATALDVTDPEPMDPNDPLLTRENVIVTPHIASASVATRSRMAMLAAQNLLAALGGRVPKDTANRDIARRWRAAYRRRAQ
ncbi:MAG: D-glycerate dehydrogenase [Chloroflexi bacterium]|nr:D-glycerate dehydrogenase [Chloroflexota bacterium]